MEISWLSTVPGDVIRTIAEYLSPVDCFSAGIITEWNADFAAEDIRQRNFRRVDCWLEARYALSSAVAAAAAGTSMLWLNIVVEAGAVIDHTSIIAAISARQFAVAEWLINNKHPLRGTAFIAAAAANADDIFGIMYRRIRGGAYIINKTKCIEAAPTLDAARGLARMFWMSQYTVVNIFDAAKIRGGDMTVLGDYLAPDRHVHTKIMRATIAAYVSWPKHRVFIAERMANINGGDRLRLAKLIKKCENADLIMAAHSVGVLTPKDFSRSTHLPEVLDYMIRHNIKSVSSKGMARMAKSVPAMMIWAESGGAFTIEMLEYAVQHHLEDAVAFIAERLTESISPDLVVQSPALMARISDSMDMLDEHDCSIDTAIWLMDRAGERNVMEFMWQKYPRWSVPKFDLFAIAYNRGIDYASRLHSAGIVARPLQMAEHIDTETAITVLQRLKKLGLHLPYCEHFVHRGTLDIVEAMVDAGIVALGELIIQRDDTIHSLPQWR